MRKWNIDCMPYMSGLSVGVVGKGLLLHIGHICCGAKNRRARYVRVCSRGGEVKTVLER